MASFKWLLLLGILGLIGYTIIPRLWMVAPGTPLEEVVKPPEISVSDVNLEGLGTEGLAVTVVLQIRNPNSVHMTLDRATFNVYIDGDYVGRGSIPTTTISSRSTQYADARTTVSWGGGLKGAWNVFKGKVSGSGSILRIDGTAYIDAPVLGTISIPFSHSKPM